MTKPPGMKLDQEKIAHHLLDDDADAELAAVLTFGAVKYDPGNWAHVEEARERYYSGARRHLRASRKGEVLDPEHGLATLASAAACIHFLLALELKANPALAETLPERLKGAIAVARELRGARLAKPAKDYHWKATTPKGRFVAAGVANSPEQAREDARAHLGKRKGKIRVVIPTPRTGEPHCITSNERGTR